MKTCLIIALLVSCASICESRADDPPPIHVVVWDERQPEQKEAYDGGFLGDHIAAELAKLPGLTVESVGLDDPEQGLPAERIENADVLIWWSHVRDGEFDLLRGRRIAERVRDGKLALVVLHSGFAGSPFKESMYSLVDERVNKALIQTVPRPHPSKMQFSVGFHYPDRDYDRKKSDPYDPHYEFEMKTPESYSAVVRMPAFTIAGFREDGRPSHIVVASPNHPIAAGLPKEFDIPQTEMYAEPFHVPEPDLVIFEETWATGEKFRSGCLWRLGKGYVFYFRPGHETYPVYKNREPMKILENAVRFLAAPKQSVNP